MIFWGIICRKVTGGDGEEKEGEENEKEEQDNVVLT